MLRRCALILSALALAGCGAATHSARQDGALPFSAIDPRTDRAAAVDPTTFERPIAHYKRYVDRQLGRMQHDIAAMPTVGRAAWLRAYHRYQTIGAAYGAFGELDVRIRRDLRAAERALWKTHTPPPAGRLATDVGRLRRVLPHAEIDALDFSLRVHEVLEDTLHLELAGIASPLSGAALTALDGNIDGTRVVLRGVGPIAAQTNRYAVGLAERALDRLDRALTAMHRPSGFPRWDSVSQLQRERIDGLTAAAAEQLAFLPTLANPLPPRPKLRAVEVTER